MESKTSLQISTLRLHVESRKLNLDIFSQCLFKTQSNMSGSSVWDMSCIHPLKRKIEIVDSVHFSCRHTLRTVFWHFPIFLLTFSVLWTQQNSTRSRWMTFFPSYSNSGSYQKHCTLSSSLPPAGSKIVFHISLSFVLPRLSTQHCNYWAF